MISENDELRSREAERRGDFYRPKHITDLILEARTRTPRRRIGSAMRKLVTNVQVRRLGRIVMARLPDRLGRRIRRIRSRVELFLDRL